MKRISLPSGTDVYSHLMEKAKCRRKRDISSTFDVRQSSVVNDSPQANTKIP